jgi:hypothetical protein
MARYKDVEGYRKLFDEEYKKTRQLISEGETHLDNLAEGFSEAGRVIDRMPTADVAPKSEVAREIFAVIDKIIIGCRVDEYSKEFGYVVRQNYNGASIVRCLAELKKKYTEGGAKDE